MSGIYIIFCKVNKRAYIGSSVNIRKRFREHTHALSNKAHRNDHLQKTWNKYGEESFVFVPVEHVESSRLLEREQQWLDSFEKDMLFNICLTAGSPLGRKLGPMSEAQKEVRRAYKHTPEAIEQIRNASKARMTDEARKHLSLIVKPPVSEETKERLSEAATAQWNRHRAAKRAA